MIVSLILAAALAADPEIQQENYQAMLSCAAFHTIEATRADADNADAQQALALDFAKAALPYAPDGKVGTANADLEKLLGQFREELDTGDVRQMAEEWTDLDSACAALYPVRDALAKADGQAATAD
jgi:hypothetical protein